MQTDQPVRRLVEMTLALHLLLDDGHADSEQAKDLRDRMDALLGLVPDPTLEVIFDLNRILAEERESLCP